MIKVQTPTPHAVVSSDINKFLGPAYFSNSVNDARHYFFTKYQYASVMQRFPANQDDSYVYFYQIEKFNVKKAIVKGRAKTTKGNQVAKRITVGVGKTVLKVYRFRKELIVSSKQHNRHFEVTLKF